MTIPTYPEGECFNESHGLSISTKSDAILQFSYHLSLLPVPHLRHELSGGVAKESNDLKIVVIQVPAMTNDATALHSSSRQF